MVPTAALSVIDSGYHTLYYSRQPNAVCYVRSVIKSAECIVDAPHGTGVKSTLRKQSVAPSRLRLLDDHQEFRLVEHYAIDLQWQGHFHRAASALQRDAVERRWSKFREPPKRRNSAWLLLSGLSVASSRLKLGLLIVLVGEPEDHGGLWAQHKGMYYIYGCMNDDRDMSADGLRLNICARLLRTPRSTTDFVIPRCNVVLALGMAEWGTIDGGYDDEQMTLQSHRFKSSKRDDVATMLLRCSASSHYYTTTHSTTPPMLRTVWSLSRASLSQPEPKHIGCQQARLTPTTHFQIQRSNFPAKYILTQSPAPVYYHRSSITGSTSFSPLWYGEPRVLSCRLTTALLFGKPTFTCACESHRNFHYNQGQGQSLRLAVQLSQLDISQGSHNSHSGEKCDFCSTHGYGDTPIQKHGASCCIVLPRWARQEILPETEDVSSVRLVYRTMDPKKAGAWRHHRIKLRKASFVDNMYSED
nr:hypothetical protein CFP56_33514 [Quercus suber]